jgi:NhaP-type Na+/H+ or K+/H+ antiporter
MWKDFLFAIIIGLLSGFVWSASIRLVRGLKNSMFTSLAFVFILYGIVEIMGLNGGIAVLSFGILLGNIELIDKDSKFRRVIKFDTSGFNSHEKDFFGEIVFIMQTYFFVYVGIAMQFGSLAIYGTGLLLVLLIIMFRVVGISLLIRKTVTLPEKAIMSVMSPKGLVPAVMASLPLQRGLPQGEIILDLVYSVVLLSIVICSVLVIILGINPHITEKYFPVKRKIEPDINSQSQQL